MSSENYHSIDPNEQAILDLVRLGLVGDAASIGQLGRKLLRRRAKVRQSEDFREQLGRLLLGHESGVLRSTAAPPIPVEPESKLPLAFHEHAPAQAAPVLDPQAAASIDILLSERRSASRLVAAGFEPPKTLLLSGAPGVGKTMTARYLAAELELPLLVVDLAALMSSFLGKTGQNLRQILDRARAAPCVLLLDEFDAVAKRRDDETDIGELKRLVNVLLLELERWPADGLLVAATNHPHLLDSAVGRRFDIRLTLVLPDLPRRAAILRDAASRAQLELSDPTVSAVALALDGCSGADLTQIIQQAARRSIVADLPFDTVLAEVALKPLRDASMTGDARRRAAFCALAVDVLGLSHREIARLLEITHPTVAKLADRWRDEFGTAEALVVEREVSS